MSESSEEKKHVNTRAIYMDGKEVQPMETPQGSKCLPADGGKDHGGADVHTAARGGRPCQSSWIFSEGTEAHGEPMQRQAYLKDNSLWKGLTQEQGKSVRRKERRRSREDLLRADRNHPQPLRGQER